MIVGPGSRTGSAPLPAGGKGIFHRADAAIASAVSDRVLALVVVGAAFFAGWHLDRYPGTWFDEGMYLQVAKNLVLHHLYAVRSADGTLDYAPIVGVGPTLLLPAAAAFWLGNITLEAARVVSALYTVIATLLVYLVARALFGRLAGICTILLLIGLPSVDWLATGRQLLGEVPSVAFLLGGAILAYRAPSARRVVLAGAMLGLTMVTKGQYLLLLPATIVCVAAIDQLDSRQRPLRWYGLLLTAALAVYAIWVGLLLVLLGSGHIVENFRQLRAASSGALLVFNIDRMLSAAKLLIGPASFMLVVPASLAGLYAIATAVGTRRLALTALWVFQNLWLGWFLVASIAWPRYAFPGLVVNVIFMGALVAWLVEALRTRVAVRAWREPRGIAQAAVGVGILALTVAGIWHALLPIARADQRDPQRFAASVQRLTPAGATIDGWEPEIGFLVDRSIQYPPPGTLDQAVRARWLGGQPPDLSSRLRGDYLMIGPFSSWVGLYNQAARSPRYVLVAEFGGYQLFKRVASTSDGAGERGAL